MSLEAGEAISLPRLFQMNPEKLSGREHSEARETADR